jgi:hypothetical protein
MWLLYTFKKDACLGDPLKLNALPYYLFGKDTRLADVFALHPTCSGQHAVVCFRCGRGAAGGGVGGVTAETSRGLVVWTAYDGRRVWVRKDAAWAEAAAAPHA